MLALVAATALPGAAQSVRRPELADGRLAGATDARNPRPLRFRGHELHPDVVHQPYTAGAFLGDSASATLRSIEAFRELLALYTQRQGEDDNFTMRVLDPRSGRTFEVVDLDAERARYERTGEADWDRIDELRRDETRRLMDKYRARGYREGTVAVRWGRANQVREARERDLPFIEYEMRLARLLGLSLLATEIGTVETFNQDRLVSTAGARSRYQMMPYLLRRNGIRQYQLRTASGRSVPVFEEWHPLLTMEPAFLVLRGYVNAVGHEIPGISAYHTGPGNIFSVYERFLGRRYGSFPRSAGVLDAYVWAVTDGFEAVSRGTSFGAYSRAYVATAYGSLRATEDLPIDTSRTFLAERVQLHRGREVLLSRLLRALERSGRDLRWGSDDTDGASTYERFRAMNPHLSLPEGRGERVPLAGDVRLVDQVKGAPVRFFLPLGATRALADAGLDVVDPRATFRFDHATYAAPDAAAVTDADREYDRLVDDIERFGFTRANRSRLAHLRERFERLAALHPTHYRHARLEIIREHERLWQSRPFEDLADARAAATRKLTAR